MQALSLLQPWAALVMVGAKRYETRSWGTKVRGRIAIHASEGQKKELVLALQTQPFASVIAANYDQRAMACGAVLGTVEIVDVVPIIAVRAGYYAPSDSAWVGAPSFGAGLISSGLHAFPPAEHERAFGDYGPGRFAWILREPMLFAKPVPYRGMLGLWELPESVLLEGAR